MAQGKNEYSTREGAYMRRGVLMGRARPKFQAPHLFTVVSAAILLPFFFSVPAVSGAPATAAEVNDRKISREEVERERRLRFPPSRADFSPDDTRAMEKILIQQLVERELLYQEAARLNKLPGKDDVANILAKAKESVGGTEAFREELERLGTTEEEFAAGTRTDLAIRRLLETEVYSAVTVTEQEVQKEYETRKPTLAAPLEVRVRDISLGLDPGVDEAAARENAEAIRAEAAADTKRFAELARKHSQGPAQGKGGDLGYLTRNQLPPELAESAFSLEPEELSPVLKARGGFHILLVEAKRGGEVPEFSLVRGALEKEMLRERKEKALESYLEELRKKGKVIIYSQ